MIYKVVVGEKALGEINRRMNGKDSRVRFNGCFAHTDHFKAEAIDVQDGGKGRYYRAFILTMDHPDGTFYEESKIRRKVYEDFEAGRYHKLFEHRP